jgi:predicted XRE-type DNA-binding protein
MTKNVFEDLGFSPEEAAALKLKTDLHTKIVKSAACYSQKQLQTLLDESQPRVSDLLRGKMSKFSLEMLVIYAEKLGLRTEIRTTKARSRGAAAGLALILCWGWATRPTPAASCGSACWRRFGGREPSRPWFPPFRKERERMGQPKRSARRVPEGLPKVARQFYWRAAVVDDESRAGGTIEILVVAFRRPAGTRFCAGLRRPALETPGYCQMSLTGHSRMAYAAMICPAKGCL